MIGGIKTIEVFPGKEEEFEKLFALLKQEVRANEQGNEYYDLYKSKTESQKYFVLERYHDQHALASHDESAHGKIYFPKIRALLKSINVEYINGL